MKTRNYGLYALAAAIVVVGALWAGLPVGSLWMFGPILVCPLIMFFMMRGMHGGNNGAMHDGSGGRGTGNQNDLAGSPTPPKRPASPNHGATR